jgi:predicted metal-dependent HD superfamily phosphohydrolase
MNLQERHAELLLKSGFNTTEISTLWQELEKVYSVKSRHYHNLTHLEEMIVLFDHYQSKLQFPDEVLYSIFYHDYVYKVTRKDNELKSAEKAISILPIETKLNKELVFDMICATQLHQHNQIEDVNWLIDFDLRILAKDWNDYQMYCNQIRSEYRIYPNFMYKPGRKKALQQFLEHAFIFQTEEFRTNYESQARANIEKEIKMLT